MVIVTGAAGSVGRRLVTRLRKAGHDVVATDLLADGVDLLDEQHVEALLAPLGPDDVVYHLAGAKHAPDGEDDPWTTARTNIVSTRNILNHSNCRVVLASTCKAADPETAYGASKLIAERMVLNADGVVCRFYNIPETDGNVFRLWETIPDEDPIPVTGCYRRLMPMPVALDLLEAAADLPSGRYTIGPPPLESMAAIAGNHHPGRPQTVVARRRGDRIKEPACAASEALEDHGWIVRIVSVHDREPVWA